MHDFIWEYNHGLEQMLGFLGKARQRVKGGYILTLLPLP